MLAIGTYATRSYTYAMREQLPMLVAALQYAEYQGEVVWIFACDNSSEAKTAFDRHARQLDKMGVKCHAIKVDCGRRDGKNKGHKQQSNKLIATMQAAAMGQARAFNVDEFWSLESDILPQAKTLRVCLDSLKWDKGYYDVVMCTYPNSNFLGGHGTPQHWICDNVYPDERKLPPDLQKRFDRRKKLMEYLSHKQKQPTMADRNEWRKVDELVKQCPPIGNVFALNARSGWRPRGWLTDAYPGVGMGALLPTRWVGMGCTLLSKRALSLAEFTGYDGGGTQDLWLSWKCWQAHGLNLAVSSHALCSHAKIVQEKGKIKHIVYHAFHEMMGLQQGHLRMETRPFNTFTQKDQKP